MQVALFSTEIDLSSKFAIENVAKELKRVLTSRQPEYILKVDIKTKQLFCYSPLNRKAKVKIQVLQTSFSREMEREIKFLKDETIPIMVSIIQIAERKKPNLYLFF